MGSSPGCTASGGDKDGPCIFPYEYEGTVHNECKDHDYSGKEWCATEVDDGELEKWGYCGCGCDMTTTSAATTTSAPTTTDSLRCSSSGGEDWDCGGRYKIVHLM